MFRMRAEAMSSAPYGNGHINETFLVEDRAKDRYILQKINSGVFRDVPGLMRNIRLVTDHLAGKDPDERHTLTLVKTWEDTDFLLKDGAYWRMYRFVEDSLCLDLPRSDRDFASSGRAFGMFQRKLHDFPVDSLREILPDFHHTPKRMLALEKAVAEDPMGRKAKVKDEIAFALERRDDCGELLERESRGLIAARVTHNDTKLNNVLLDINSGEPLCVIDLDTVMPGLAAYDYGDSIRFGASTAREDERDIGKVSVSMERTKAFSEAYLDACGEGLTPNEIRSLPTGARLMTFECGIRFLTDYLEGDRYFHTGYPEHNLIRCRTQFRLVSDMEAKWNEMNAAVGCL